MQETQIRTLSWEESLEKEMATYSSILAWESHRQEPTVHGIARVRHNLVTKPPPPLLRLSNSSVLHVYLNTSSRVGSSQLAPEEQL